MKKYAVLLFFTVIGLQILFAAPPSGGKPPHEVYGVIDGAESGEIKAKIGGETVSTVAYEGGQYELQISAQNSGKIAEISFKSSRVGEVNVTSGKVTQMDYKYSSSDQSSKDKKSSSGGLGGSLSGNNGEKNENYSISLTPSGRKLVLKGGESKNIGFNVDVSGNSKISVNTRGLGDLTDYSEEFQVSDSSQSFDVELNSDDVSAGNYTGILVLDHKKGVETSSISVEVQKNSGKATGDIDKKNETINYSIDVPVSDSSSDEATLTVESVDDEGNVVYSEEKRVTLNEDGEIKGELSTNSWNEGDYEVRTSVTMDNGVFNFSENFKVSRGKESKEESTPLIVLLVSLGSLGLLAYEEYYNEDSIYHHEVHKLMEYRKAASDKALQPNEDLADAGFSDQSFEVPRTGHQGFERELDMFKSKVKSENISSNELSEEFDEICRIAEKGEYEKASQRLEQLRRKI